MSLVFHDFIQVSSTESMRVHTLPYPYQFNVFIAMWKIFGIMNLLTSIFENLLHWE